MLNSFDTFCRENDYPWICGITCMIQLASLCTLGSCHGNATVSSLATVAMQNIYEHMCVYVSE